ncbi:MAG: hypothetical protein RLZZ292_218 [Bacteroidota bacterium]|jgi:hypothetical protein
MKKLLFLFLWFCSITNSDAQTSKLAVIIGNGVRIREQANFKGKEIVKILTKEIVEILEVTTTKQSITGELKDTCGFYPWVKIRYNNKTEGWVFGKYVFKLEESEKDKARLPQNRNIKLGNESYTLIASRNFQQGCDVPLSFCNDFAVVMLLDDKREKVKIFPAPQHEKLSNPGNFNYWHINTDNGVYEKIIKIEKIDDQKYLLQVYQEFQEDCALYKVEISIDPQETIHVLEYQLFDALFCKEMSK